MSRTEFRIYREERFCPGAVLEVWSGAGVEEFGFPLEEDENGEVLEDATVLTFLATRNRTDSQIRFQSRDPELFALARSCGERKFFLPLLDWLREQEVGGFEFQSALRHFVDRDSEALVEFLVAYGE